VAHYKRKSPRRWTKARRYEHSWTCQGRLRYQRRFRQIEREEAELLDPGWCNGNMSDFESDESRFEPWSGS
jgi:hypothetical protein